MTPMGSRMRLEFLVPTRGLFGYRNEFLTDTQRRRHHEPPRSTATHPSRVRSPAALTGSLVAFETGEAAAYGLVRRAGPRLAVHRAGRRPVYAGMIVRPVQP